MKNPHQTMRGCFIKLETKGVLGVRLEVLLCVLLGLANDDFCGLVVYAAMAAEGPALAMEHFEIHTTRCRNTDLHHPRIIPEVGDEDALLRQSMRFVIVVGEFGFAHGQSV